MIVNDIHHPCGRLLAPDGWSRPRQASLGLADHELWLVWEGFGWMSDGRARRRLEPGSCVWMRPGGIYDAQRDPNQPFGFTYIHFAPMPGINPPEHFFVDPVFASAVMQRIVALIPRAPAARWGESARPTPAALHLLAGLLEDLLRLGPEQAWAGADVPLRQLAQRLWDDPAHAPSVRSLARSMRLSPPHFCRRFRQAIGMSPQQWVIEARLHQARLLLRDSTLPIARIAESLGYCDPYAFSKQFKRFVGLSPSRYRAE